MAHAYKGSAAAKRATKRGGNPVRTQHARPVRHHFSVLTDRCTMCRVSKHRVFNLWSGERRRLYCA